MGGSDRPGRRPLATRRHALALGDRPTPAAQWRLDPLGDGGYRLTNRDGWTARAGAAGGQVPEPDMPQVICADGVSLFYSMWVQGG